MRSNLRTKLRDDRNLKLRDILNVTDSQCKPEEHQTG
jgi:hypothetical protein